jgi:hypothetical protein
MFFGFPGLKYDGVDRTAELNEKNFNKTTFAKDAKSIVLFSDVEADDDELDQYECFLQLTAQVMERRGYKVYTVNTTKELKLRKQEEVDKGEDTIHVYEDGYKIEYFGVIDPDTFVSWIMDIPDEPLTIINSKHDEEEFDSLEDSHTRILGFFDPGSQALKEYEEAAEDFMGEVEFYAVVDTFWARRMGINKLNEVRMYRPFEDEPLIAPSSADTEDEFEDWVEKNHEPVMQRLTLQNYFNVWKDPEEDEKLVVAFCDEETEEGKAVLKLLKELANMNKEHAGELEIVLIDPDEFPMMIDEWEHMFDIEIEAGPVLGLVDVSEREGVWFDMGQLNLNEPKKYKSQNLEVLDSWIDQIMSGAISLDDEPEPPPPPPTKGKKKKGEL